MSLILDREIGRLKKQILMQGAMVEENVMRASRSIQQQDTELAREVIERDRQIDQMEIQTEEECLKILALHQPVATDLRYIIAALKINNDLERIGDLAASLAKNGLNLFGEPQPPILLNLDEMADHTQNALRNSLDAMIQFNGSLAHAALKEEEAVDAMHEANKEQLYKAMQQHPEYLRQLQCLLQMSRRLERIADHATNIAEDVLYMLEGEITRHQAASA